VKSFCAAAAILYLLSACASNRPDHFYILTDLPAGASEARPAPSVQASLQVTLPALVDRSEMLLNTSPGGVLVLEHERWAAPLADLMTQTLARDLERRRTDMLVAARDLGRARSTAVRITIDVVQITMRQGDRVSIDAHWRIVDPRSGTETVGGDEFSAALRQDGYAAIAQGLSESLALLADRVAGLIK
jgi:uncharacterized protein